ncbi:MAG: hypothetical protein NTX53_03195 [candidate division WOR-3 bacterium]|nr:hypothetical protein [candidate division WOR-3 bacterium]
MVFVRHGESTFVFLYSATGGNAFLNAYMPKLGWWTGNLPSPPVASNLALAYARDAMRMYAIGYFPNNGGNRFYTYVFDSPSGSGGVWSSESLPFDVNPSAYGGGYTKMTYRRNRDLAPLHAMPGWLYAIGRGASAYVFNLYRYWIPNPGDAAVMGYNPGNTAVIADATPHFVWPSVPSALEYRIKVSSELSFSAVELDTVTVDTTFQVPVTLPLTNGQQYWQTWSRGALGNWTAGPVLQFSLSAGWDSITRIPIQYLDFPMTGATLVYTCMGPTWPKAESLWYTSGTASGWDTMMLAYSIHNGNWPDAVFYPQSRSLDHQDNIMASAPSEYGLEQSNQIYAVLDTNDTVGHHWKLDLAAEEWRSLQTSTPFPVGAGMFCRLVFDAELDTLYATAGAGSSLFYARCPGSGDGQQQAGANGPLLPGLAATARSGVVSVRYSLSAPERARLDIFDPVGRKVLSRDMGVQAAGEHYEQVTQSELGTQRQVARAGILLLRLTHGTTTERAKVVLF